MSALYKFLDILVTLSTAPVGVVVRVALISTLKRSFLIPYQTSVSMPRNPKNKKRYLKKRSLLASLLKDFSKEKRERRKLRMSVKSPIFSDFSTISSLRDFVILFGFSQRCIKISLYFCSPILNAKNASANSALIFSIWELMVLYFLGAKTLESSR